MSHDLLMNLTEEQQELVSGGGQLEKLEELDYTNFENQYLNFRKDISSNKDGSTIKKHLENDFVFTEAYEDLKLKFDDDNKGYHSY